jgi:hypothetical protein
MNWRIPVTKTTCPCCFGAGEIENRAPVPLTPQQFQIFDIVRRSKYGIDGEGLTNRLYADRSDGGPPSGRKCMQVQIIHLNRRLEKANLRIGAKTHRGPYFLLQTQSSGAERAA